MQEKREFIQRKVYAVFFPSWIFGVPEKAPHFGFKKGVSHEDQLFSFPLTGVSNLHPMGYIQPKMAVNVAHHKITNLLKTLRGFFCDCVSQYI